MSTRPVKVGSSLSRRVAAIVGDRHADVHQDDIGLELAGEFNCLVAVLGLADDVDLVVSLEDQAEAAAHERLVVGEQDADHVGRTARTAYPPSSRARVLRVPS
jgi:hypothetical protein